MTTSLQQHHYILELAALGQLPEQLDDASEYPLPVIRELIGAGHLAALNVSTLGGEAYLNPHITLTGREYLRKLQSEHEAEVDELLAVLDKMRAIMTTVATSNYPIDDANDEYQKLYRSADAQLRRMGIVHTNPYRSLWDWRARWKSGDLPSYQSRRDFLAQVFTPLMQQVSEKAGSSLLPASLTSGAPGHTQESPPPTPPIRSLPALPEVPQPLDRLTGQQVKQLRNVLVNAFSKDGLRQMVRMELEENLEAIVGGDNLGDIAFDLISWAEREGRVFELVRAVHETVPQNEQVQQIWYASHHWYTDQ